MKKSNIVIGILIVIIIIQFGIIIKQQHKDNGSIVKSIEKNEKSISKEEFKKYIKKVDITTENWKDYFVLERNIHEEKNSFGDIVSTANYFIFKLNNSYYDIAEFNGISLEVEIPKEKALNLGGEIYNTKIIDFYNSAKQSNEIYDGALIKNADVILTIDDFKCIRAKGSLYYLDNIPSEFWNVNEDSLINGKPRECIKVDDEFYYNDGSNTKTLKDYYEE